MMCTEISGVEHLVKMENTVKEKYIINRNIYKNL